MTWKLEMRKINIPGKLENLKTTIVFRKSLVKINSGRFLLVQMEFYFLFRLFGANALLSFLSAQLLFIAVLLISLYLSVFYCSFYLTVAWLLLLSVRILGRLPMLLGNCPWRRLKDIWRMFWLTSKPFRSGASVGVLDGLHRLKTVILMARGAGLSNLQSSFWICSRTLRVTQKYALSY